MTDRRAEVTDAEADVTERKKAKSPCPFCVGHEGNDSCWFCVGEGWIPAEAVLNRG